MSKTEILSVVKAQPSDGADVAVLIDEYIPLRIRTAREPLGVNFIRFGNYATTLLEVGVEPWSQAVRGVSVTAIREIEPWPLFDIVAVRDGLPVLATASKEREVVDSPRDFVVATRPGEILATWQKLEHCEGFKAGPVVFLTVDKVLAGVWVSSLDDEAVRLFESHAASN